MKRLLSGLFASAAIVSASALTISPAVKINTNGPAHNPQLSPDGKTLLYSSDSHTGLKALELATENVIVLDDAPGAGFCPVFSTDGKTVVYQTAQLVDGLMKRDVHAFSFTDGKSEKLTEATRNDINLNEISGKKDYVFANYDHIVIANNGETTSLCPIANAHSYLWASLSPDGKRIAFVEPFQGVFVSDLDGNNLVRIAAKGDFPAWASDNLVTFVTSHDDGYVILDSTLRIYDMTTKVTVSLTPEDVKVGESTATDGGIIVYSTLDGELFKISVE